MLRGAPQTQTNAAQVGSRACPLLVLGNVETHHRTQRQPSRDAEGNDPQDDQVQKGGRRTRGRLPPAGPEKHYELDDQARSLELGPQGSRLLFLVGRPSGENEQNRAQLTHSDGIGLPQHSCHPPLRRGARRQSRARPLLTRVEMGVRHLRLRHEPQRRMDASCTLTLPIGSVCTWMNSDIRRLFATTFWCVDTSAAAETCHNNK